MEHKIHVPNHQPGYILLPKSNSDSRIPSQREPCIIQVPLHCTRLAQHQEAWPGESPMDGSWKMPPKMDDLGVPWLRKHPKSLCLDTMVCGMMAPCETCITIFLPSSQWDSLGIKTNWRDLQHTGNTVHLVGGFNPSEKYEFVNGKDDIPYMKWKIIHSCSKPTTRDY